MTTIAIALALAMAAFVAIVIGTQMSRPARPRTAAHKTTMASSDGGPIIAHDSGTGKSTHRHDRNDGKDGDGKDDGAHGVGDSGGGDGGGGD